MFLRLFTSNRMEILAEMLAEVLSTPLSSILDTEIIVVQSKGMERWISMELARRHGICSNYCFPFPNAFIHTMFQKIVPHVSERSTFDPAVLTWIIMKVLPSCIKRHGFRSLRAYLEGAGNHLKRLQLCERIAHTYDQYLVFRPEMIFQWERGEENHWQAALWRELIKGDGADHRAALGKMFLDALQERHGVGKGFPERVSVFGISALPRFHMQILEGISRFTEVNLFLMNPCREYWGDIRSEKEIRKTKAKRKDKHHTADELYLESGNSLLASMGTLGRDFFDLLHEFNCEENESFGDPDGRSLLSCIQSDILDLVDREGPLHDKKIIPEKDRSIQIHSCHSPMREIEVLQDRLLDIFESDPELMPKDIVVMIPDIEKYAPYIQAVFDMPYEDPRRIPFTIADRSVRQESKIVDTFLALLDLAGSRFGVSQVCAILESPAVRRRFDLDDGDYERIQRWIHDTRIRWGIDGGSRSRAGLHPFRENTWKAGLERLMLGYAMPGQYETMMKGVVPYDNVEGSDSLVLGRFIEFMEQLFQQAADLEQPRTLEMWSHTLSGILDGFFKPDDDSEREMHLIRRTINSLADMQELADFREEIDIKTVHWHIGRCFENEGYGFGFITGGITFCAMLPMRSIPFKVTCLVGMNHDAYPRQSVTVGFDLMMQKPRPGDRSKRNDDRYLFLEAILSTRDTLYVSYEGQSIKDNSSKPPSVMVNELIDYIEAGFQTPGKDMRDHLLIQHRLQAFQPGYFGDHSSNRGSNLFSYSGQNYKAATCLMRPPGDPVQFISRGLSEPADEWKVLRIDDLCRFFSNPARYLLNRRLGIYLDKREDILRDSENFDIPPLEEYLLAEELVKRTLEGRSRGDLHHMVQAAGMIPHGAVGDCMYEVLIRGVERFVEKTVPYMGGKPFDPLDVHMDIDGFTVTGRIGDIYPEHALQFRYARLRPRDHLKVWINHLVLNYVMSIDCPRKSIMATLRPRPGEPLWTAWEYLPVEDSETILKTLLDLYWAGLKKPLHFFPGAAWEYVRMILEKEKQPDIALRQAHAKWVGSDYHRGECEDLYYQLCFGTTDPLDEDFRQVACTIYEPILQNSGEMAG